MTLCVVEFHVIKITGVLESRMIPVEIPQPFVDGRISTSDISNVALEVLNVNGVKTDDGGVKTDIGLCQSISKEIWSSFCKAFLDLVQGFKERDDVRFVCGLCCGKAGFVNAIVDSILPR